MPLATPPRVRSVVPTSEPRLHDFSCGPRARYEQDIDELVQWFAREGDVCMLFRVAEETPSGPIVGLYGVGERRFPSRPRWLPRIGRGVLCIEIIAVASEWRGRGVGAFLLGDALEEIRKLTGNPILPPIYALIATENTASHRVFERWGFHHVPAEGDDDDWRYRPAGPLD
jgi:GNAT superfamily N-acetyltransferase